MALQDILNGFSSGFSGIGSGLSSFNVAGIGGIVFLVGILFVVFKFSSGGLATGSFRERREVKWIGNVLFAATRFTGRGLLAGMIGGIKGSRKLASLSTKALGNSRAARNIGQYTKRLIRGEQENIEEDLHQVSTAASSTHLAAVIGSLANAELKADAGKEAIELRIEEIDRRLSQIGSIGEIDEHAIGFAKQAGNEISNSLLMISTSEDYELRIRRKAFDEAYRLLKIIERAQISAKKIEAKAKKNANELSEWNRVEINDLRKYLKDMLKEETKKINEAQKAWTTSTGDAQTRNALYEQINIARQNQKIISDNIARILMILGRLESMNQAMIDTYNKMGKELDVTFYFVELAFEKEITLRQEEKRIDSIGQRITETVRESQKQIAKHGNFNPEELIIFVTGEAGAVFDLLLSISRKMLEVDSDLRLLVNNLIDAMARAYRVEEATRVANSYYKKLMKANEDFYALVVQSDLKQEVKDAFLKEIQIEKMEEGIGEKQESMTQASKFLFIRAINQLKKSLEMVEAHIADLNKSVSLTEQTRKYTLEVLTAIMRIIGIHKVKINREFAQRAEVYMDRLNDVKKTGQVARLAA